jgi:hypothetical protein
MDEDLKKYQTWESLTPDERFERMAWSVATSTALETCESPHEIYRRMMARHQQSKKTEG